MKLLQICSRAVCRSTDYPVSLPGLSHCLPIRHQSVHHQYIMADIKKLKDIACAAIDKARTPLHDLSKSIWNSPELAFKEHHAHSVLTDFLETRGFNVERKYKLDTAFRATFGDGGGPNIAVISEYDALPDIGHACGHNLIAEVGVGAGLGIRAALKAADKPLGKVTVVGTPAEEGGGGKLQLITDQVFQGIDASFMAHPWSYDSLHFPSLARQSVTATFHGKASHAAGAPWEGVNALDAAVTAYQSMSNMRQQMKPTWRVHGVFTNGGSKPNIIPEESELLYYIRTPSEPELTVLKQKTKAIFEGAAAVAGCTVDIYWDPKPYSNMITNSTLAGLYEVNGVDLGVEFTKDEAVLNSATGSTDMGNVSHVVPSIHPMYTINTTAVNHTRDFTTAAGAPEAQEYTIKQAKALAMTAIDIYCQPQLLDKIQQDFKDDLEREKNIK